MATYYCTVKPFISIFIATLIVASTVGVTVSKHFCSSKIAEVGESAVCVCESSKNGCDAGHTDGCCDTEKSFFQIDYNFAASPVESLNIMQVSVLSVLVYNMALEFDMDVANTSYRTYRPPMTVKDIPVLLRSLII